MKKIKYLVIKFLARRLITIITEEDVLRIVGKDFYLGKNKLSQEETDALKADAKMFLASPLWRFMKLNWKFLATKKIAEHAKNHDDVAIGGVMFTILEVFDGFLTKVGS